MRVHVAGPACALGVACTVLGFGAARASPSADGRLAGLTQITYGCPGPQRVGQPCEHWSPFAHARFAVTHNGSDGNPTPSTRRVLVSDYNGRFSLRLPAGAYTITPLPQTHTHGGKALAAHVHVGQTTHATIRFFGYPAMV